MTKEELIKSLTLLKEQARNSGANTFVWDINIDGFNFVIDSAIKALEQEPMVEIDLYSVIKQKYIERDVLDKLRAEIETEKLEDSSNFCIKAHNIAVDRVLQILDKYRADTEVDNGNDDR